MRNGRRGIVLLAALGWLPAACSESGDLAELAAQELEQGFCCRIVDGEPALVGSVEIDLALDREECSQGPLFFDPRVEFSPCEAAMAVNGVTPAGALRFAWTGPLVASGREDDNPAGLVDFDPDLDVGGFGQVQVALFPAPDAPPDGAETLRVYAADCGFERASFEVVIFTFKRLGSIGPLAGGEPGEIRILARETRRYEIVNDPAACDGEEPPPEPPPIDDRIVFTRELSASPEIWTADPDTLAEDQVTTDAFHDLAPAWSPDRNAIAFASDRSSPNAFELYTMDADGGNVAQRTSFGDRWVNAPAWAPNGHEIAMTVALPGQPDTDLWIVDLDLPPGPANPRQLTQGTARDLSPTWSPDGLRIAFVRGGDILVVPVDGSLGPTTLLAGVSASSVDWSPLDELAFDRYDPQFLAMRIWRAGANGQNPARVTDGVAGQEDTSPSWSPDGTRIAFVRGEAFVEIRARRIHVMGADGSAPTPVGPATGDNVDPDW